MQFYEVLWALSIQVINVPINNLPAILKFKVLFHENNRSGELKVIK